MAALRSLVFAVLVSACGAASGPAEVAEPSPSETPGSSAPVASPAGSAEVASDAPLPAGMYRVVLTRPDRVGERARIQRVMLDMKSTRTTVDGRVGERQTHQRRLALSAVAEVLEVHPDGRAAKTRYVVERLEADTQQGKRALVPADTEIIVIRKAGTPGQLRIAAQPLKEDELEAVKALLPTTLAKTTEQDVFGSDQPHAVGDSWKLEDARARSGMQEVGLSPRGPATGSARLLERRNVGGDECLIVQGRLELDRFDLPGLPAQAKTRRSKLSVLFTGAYPIDTARPVREHDVSISMQFEATASKQGKQLVIAIESQRQITTKLEPLST